MNDLINKTKTEVTSYENLAHLVYDSMLDQTVTSHTFNIFSVFDWIIILTTTGTVVGLAWIFVLSLKLRALATLLAVTHVAKGDPIFPRRLAYGISSLGPTTTTMSSADYWIIVQEQLQQLIPVDLTLLIVLIIVILSLVSFLIYSCIYKRVFRRPSTVLTLAIGNGTVEHLFRLAYLQYPLNFYQLHVSKERWQARIIDRGCHSYLLWGKEGLRVYTYEHTTQIHLPVRIRIGPSKSNELKCMLDGDYYIMLLNSDWEYNIKDLVTLKSLPIRPRQSTAQQNDNGNDAGSLSLPSASDNLYPTRELYVAMQNMTQQTA